MSALAVERLVKRFVRRGATITAVDGISLELPERSVLAVIGESGAGKSTLARIIAGLIPPDEGRVRIGGVELGTLSRLERACAVQLVFQDPAAALDPRMRVGQLIEEPLRIHRLPDRAAELMQAVALDPALADRHPHALSGGQRQRVALARALALRPKLLVLDEPLSGLDAESAKLILQLLEGERERSGMSSVLITHDLSVAEQVGQVIAVMLNGKVVELGAPAELRRAPQHAYTRRLLATTAGKG